MDVSSIHHLTPSAIGANDPYLRKGYSYLRKGYSYVIVIELLYVLSSKILWDLVSSAIIFLEKSFKFILCLV